MSFLIQYIVVKLLVYKVFYHFFIYLNVDLLVLNLQNWTCKMLYDIGLDNSKISTVLFEISNNFLFFCFLENKGYCDLSILRKVLLKFVFIIALGTTFKNWPLFISLFHNLYSIMGNIKYIHLCNPCLEQLLFIF